ncbi:MAG: bifunctional adenosylcobinamide kinase/adenosylcobinamide-phosphate guanylyltransferase [Ruminococcus sp.]|jgi:adenosylcobinamide kinase/adenosylcobinamide-phosphate guanylyltransferase
MIHLITGGSGSGKSAYAEKCIVNFGDARRFYIATMYPFDEESFRRIERHRKMRREKKFTTVECYTNLRKLQFPSGSNVLLECMSNLVANEMYQEEGAGMLTVPAVLSGIRYLAGMAENLVIVTNEIFSDGMDYDQETARYQEYLGKINVSLASLADRVTEVVYGIPITVKGKEGRK